METRAQETPIQFLKGIGPARAAALEKSDIRTVRDLLFHVPRRYLDRSLIVSIARLRELTRGRGDGGLNTVIGEVRSFQTIGYGRRSRLVVVLTDETGSLQCVWFGGVKYWKTRFRIGELVAVSGNPSFYGNILQIVHPEVDRIAGESDADTVDPDPSQFLNTGGLVPLYPSSAELERVGLDSAGFRRVIRGVLKEGRDVGPDVIPEDLCRKRNLAHFADALRGAHQPASFDELTKGLTRLKYEELFLFQILLARRRSSFREKTDGIVFSVKSALARKLVDSLPFELTEAQIRVIREITADMESPRPLNRLLQGDVGSGKTIVALTAMLIAIENGYQAAFMAPTEILAQQHYRTIVSFLKGIDINTRLLVGKQRTKLRKEILEDIRRGSAGIVVGTHALFEQEVEFANLGFVVIDEQHRFGVMQRAALQQKGKSPDVLVMTATPIPRTLSLTLYGDLDVSVIDRLPGGRIPVETTLRADSEKQAVFEFTRAQVKQGRQVYYVYPLIEESEKLDLKAATVHFEELRTEVFPDLRLALLHGRLPNDKKEEIMNSFAVGAIDILVATTVIEVGIDVPNATLMVIENAERFGLSQLHQLRGRIGRGGERSYCILLTGKRNRARTGSLFPGSRSDQDELAEKRLKTMVSTSDGFRIAEVDLQLRGPGDFFGTRQSGVPLFRVANLVEDVELLEMARADAFELDRIDRELTLPQHKPLADHLRKMIADSSSVLNTA